MVVVDLTNVSLATMDDQCSNGQVLSGLGGGGAGLEHPGDILRGRTNRVVECAVVFSRSCTVGLAGIPKIALVN